MNIYVGNLALETTADELRQEFIPYGQVISVRMMNDKYIGSGQLKGYGFVEMASKAEAERAIMTLNGRELRGRLIEAIAALPLSDKKGDVSSHRKRELRFNGKAPRKRC